MGLEAGQVSEHCSLDHRSLPACSLSSQDSLPEVGWSLCGMASPPHPGCTSFPPFLRAAPGSPATSAGLLSRGEGSGSMVTRGCMKRKRPAKLSWEFGDSFHQITALNMR